MILAYNLLLLVLLASTIALRMNYEASSSGRGQVLGIWTTRKKCLNLGGGSADTTGSVTACELATEIKMSMLKLKAKYMKENGMGVDYASLRASDEYQDYIALTQKLQSIDLKSLKKYELKGFLINIYNCLCIHALAEGLLSPFPGGTLSRLRLYAKASYIIGGVVFSLNDIENGLLRNNKVSAAPWSRPPFQPGDPSLPLCVECDARIHFALNCGAKSCPPIAVYSVESSEELERQLDIATLSFVSSPQNVKIDVSRKTLEISQLFEWYADDFDNDVVGWLKDHMEDPEPLNGLLRSLAEGEKPEVRSVPYDWSLNSM
jgi:hypothetical protein